VVDAEALPLAALVIEPAKVMFLNNAVNHGVLGPLGVQQAAETGSSILFLLEANPGPGLGILLAYFVFHRGTIKQSAPGAMLIHFFGGIHEVYFPYALMQPRLLLAVMGGGAAGILVFSLSGAGLVAVPSPGSILTVMAMSPKGGLFPVLAGVFASTLVSFALGALLINRKATTEQEQLTLAKEKLTALKGVKTLLGHDCIPDDLKDVATLRLIAVACDAGMGSSAMGASKLRAALAEAGAELKVISCSVDQLARPVELVISHERLLDRAIKTLPEAAHIAVTNFITTPVYAELAKHIVMEQRRCQPKSASSHEHDDSILTRQNIKLGLSAMSKEQAIRLAGSILYEGGYVAAGYTAGMLARESDFSTYIGNGAAIPHGSSSAREYIKHTGLCILQFPGGIDFDGNTAYLVIGIAALGDQHLQVLAELAKTMEDASAMQQLRTTVDVDTVYRQFSNSATAVT
jgi:PTS system mannitol-specific IIC component